MGHGNGQVDRDGSQSCRRHDEGALAAGLGSEDVVRQHPIHIVDRRVLVELKLERLLLPLTRLVDARPECP